MEVYIWLLCFIIGGVTASSCDNVDCGQSPFEDLNILEYRPSEADLIRLCPRALEFLNCYFRVARECLGMEVEEIAETGDEIGKVLARYFLSWRGLTNEMCNEQSTLRKNYLENRECFEGLFGEANDVSFDCMEKGETNARAFLKQRNNIEDDENVNFNEMNCLQQAYHWACFTERIDTTCGEVAAQTFLSVVDYFKSQMAECEIENPLALKQSFLDYLGLEGRVSELYKSAFDIFKRR